MRRVAPILIVLFAAILAAVFLIHRETTSAELSRIESPSSSDAPRRAPASHPTTSVPSTAPTTQWRPTILPVPETPLVRGIVRWLDTHEPVGGGKVDAGYRVGELWTSESFDIHADGRFAISRPSADHALESLRFDAASAEGAYFGFTTVRREFSPPLGNQAATVDVEIEVSRGAAMTVRVVDKSNGAPLSGAVVQLDEMRSKAVATTDADGLCTITGIEVPQDEEEEFRYASRPSIVRLSGYRPAYFWAPAARSGVVPATIVVPMDRTVKVSGRVLDADGRPLPKATVWIRPDSAAAIGCGAASADGASLTTDAAGRFHVETLLPTSAATIEAFDARGIDATIGGVDLSRDRSDLELRLPKTTPIAIYARAAGGERLPATAFTAIVDDGKGPREVAAKAASGIILGRAENDAWIVDCPIGGTATFDVIVEHSRKDRNAERGTVQRTIGASDKEVVVDLRPYQPLHVDDALWLLREDWCRTSRYELTPVDGKTGRPMESGSVALAWTGEEFASSMGFSAKQPIVIALGPIRATLTFAVRGFRPVTIFVNGRLDANQRLPIVLEPL